MRDGRVELQAEVAAPRDAVWPLVASEAGLRRWLDEASMDGRRGGAVRLRLHDATATGTIVSWSPALHWSMTWDWEGAPMGTRTVVAFDLAAHGERTHLTLRHVGLPAGAATRDHDALWRHWFDRLVRVAREAVPGS
jgi:hypothetical protein